MRKKLHKRIRRKRFGANVDVRIYEDGTLRIRVDHPSDDPGVEIGIVRQILEAMNRAGKDSGMKYETDGTFIWKSDPPR